MYRKEIDNKDKDERIIKRIIGSIIVDIGVLTSFIQELSKGMYVHSYISLYILLCSAFYIFIIGEEIKKSDIWKIIYGQLIELVIGIALAIVAYKYEYGGMILMGAVLLLLAFYEIQAFIAIVKYKKEKNNLYT